MRKLGLLVRSDPFVLFVCFVCLFVVCCVFYNLLPNVNPTFEWIRLAQRIPVRIQLDTLPDGVELRTGTTASVLVMTGQ